MSKVVHAIYIWTMVLITVAVTLYLSYTSYVYYNTAMEERYYLENHDWFKPSGILGHGLGIVGTLLMLFGVVIYILHKRYNFLGKWIRLKYLLEFHIFLCTLGPIMILFHTAFKFGGIVSVAFWSMVAVVLSGVIGRFIYIQIPRSIEGRELSMNEIRDMKSSVSEELKEKTGDDEEVKKLLSTLTESNQRTNFWERRQLIRQVKKALSDRKVKRRDKRLIIGMIKVEMSLANRISRLQTMQKLFKYWHVAHLPFALIMLIIVVIHVAVTLAFGYTWIFG